MTKLSNIILSLGFIFCTSFVQSPVKESASSKYKCLIQLSNYEGEGPYIVVSVLDKENQYLGSVQVLGEDERWYEDITDWWTYMEASSPEVDAVTRPSIPAGSRAVFVMAIKDEWVDAGNKIRFGTAVEDQKYVKDDLLLPLTSETLNGKFEGKDGYIRYVRIIPN
ncbi:MAG: DUF2271 domain-containing protein [Bacteroidota bacterium]